MDLSKEELATEIKAIDESIAAHESQMKLHTHAIKVDICLRDLMGRELSVM